MKTVPQIIEEYGEKLEIFKSPLTQEWETVLFKAIDTLHNLEQEGIVETEHIKSKLLSIVISGNYDEVAVNTAIEELQDIYEEMYSKKYVSKIIGEIIELLFAVKIYHKRGSGGRSAQ